MVNACKFLTNTRYGRRPVCSLDSLNYKVNPIQVFLQKAVAFCFLHPAQTALLSMNLPFFVQTRLQFKIQFSCIIWHIVCLQKLKGVEMAVLCVLETECKQQKNLMK